MPMRMTSIEDETETVIFTKQVLLTVILGSEVLVWTEQPAW